MPLVAQTQINSQPTKNIILTIPSLTACSKTFYTEFLQVRENWTSQGTCVVREKYFWKVRENDLG